MSEIILTIEGVDPVALYGQKNSKLDILKNAYPDVTFTSRGHNLKLVGDKKQTQSAKANVEMMVNLLKANHDLTDHTVMDLVKGANPFDTKLRNSVKGNTIVYGRGG